MQIRLVSLMAPNADPMYLGIAAYLRERTGLRVDVEESAPWQERERMLERGEAHMGFICGLPYVHKVDRPDPVIELLAAPVMRGARYGGRPVYFSDVVVRRGSSIGCFADLRGASWAYNEPASQSGYNLTRYHLARLGETGGYFGRLVEAGAHEASIRMVAGGTVDASAIDSTVLELELARHPELKPLLRVIHTFGPSAIPPAVVSTRVPRAIRRALRDALLRMHADPDGERALDLGNVCRFAPVRDRHYDGIRRMYRAAQGVRWPPAHQAALTLRPCDAAA
jgi:phosphonate transport system substrate-binding protein